MLLRCLEVVNGLDSANYLCGRLDVLDDLVHALISHRRLVKSVGNDAGGVNTCHLLLVLCHGETLEGGGTGHQTSCTVRCGAVPILVALAYAILSLL